MVYSVDAWLERMKTGIAKVSGLHVAFSDDGVHWRPSPRPLVVDFASIWPMESVSWEASILWDVGSDTTGWLVYSAGAAPPDAGAPWGQDQHMVGRRITLSAGSPGADAGAPGPSWPVCVPTPNPACGAIAHSCIAPSTTVTDVSNVGSTGATYGVGDNVWVTFAAAATGQSAPVVAATTTGLSISGNLVAPPAAGQNWALAGLYYAEANCLDASKYTGVQFTLSGGVGTCSLGFALGMSADASSSTIGGDPGRGACSATTCYPPSYTVTAPTTSTPTTIQVPFTALKGGSPVTTFNASTITSVYWQLTAPAGGGGCSASFLVSDVAFY
jgi:hypothetical protein